MTGSECSISGCEGRVRARLLCGKHYQRWAAGKDPTSTPITQLSAWDRFWSKVQIADCWVWTAGRDWDGYGIFTDHGTRRAHRWAYEHLVGEIPKGLQLDHLCRNRACVNPDHLEPVTSRTNTMRGATLAATNAIKTHCPQGHPYDRVRGSGDRACSECARIHTRNSRFRKVAS